MDEDTQDAAEQQQMLDEQRQHEDILLDRALSRHEQLRELQRQSEESCSRIRWAIDRIFHS